LEFIILDDQSTDHTSALLAKHTQIDLRFRVMNGRRLPSDWIGKVHACQQLQKEAKGDYFLFLDADVRLKAHTVEKTLALLLQKKGKLLTGFSAFEVPTFLSKLLVPMQHFVVLFHLPLMIANRTNMPAATAAHGAFMFFERKTYQQLGGHKKVRSSLVEDVHLAREMKKEGHKVILANITADVNCRMYETNQEVWEGFLKNIFNGLGRSTSMVWLLSLFYGLFYAGPLIFLVMSLITLNGYYTIPYFIIAAQALFVHYVTNQRLALSLLMPLSAISFIIIMNASMFKAWFKQSYVWKGRHYS
jgi:cellulose synthase/poly-beta-1,6-N-acetylglucosamine synthase-like glycosyltransferase